MLLLNRSAIILLLLTILCHHLTRAQNEDGLPECIILDPKDAATFLMWHACDGVEKTFVPLEYTVDIFEEPFEKTSLYAFGNTEAGVHCIETDLATTISEDVYFEIVYLIKSVPGKSNLSLTYTEGLLLNFDRIIGTWDRQYGELGAIGKYKIQMKGEIGEGDLILIESLILTDMNSKLEECQIGGEEEPGTNSPSPNTDSSVSIDPFPSSSTIESSPSSEPTSPSDSSSTDGSTSPDYSTSFADSTSPVDSTSPAGSSSTDGSTSPEASNSPSEPTTWIYSSSSPSFTTEGLSSLDPDPSPPEGSTPEPLVTDSPDESNEVAWMTTAIVFIGLFGVSTIFIVYKYFLPKRTIPSAMNQNIVQNPSTVERGNWSTQSGIQKLPRLQVDRLQGGTVIHGKSL